MHGLSRSLALAATIVTLGCGDDGAVQGLDPDAEDPSTGVPLDGGGAPPSLDARVERPLDASSGSPRPDASDDDAGGPSLSPRPSFRLLTYNVAGLPEGISSSKPSVNSPLISPLLNDYQLALLQEDFSYHAAIVGQAKHPHQSPINTSGQSLGDGLSFLSVFPFSDFARVAWRDCNGLLDSGSDCLTPKGFVYARLQLPEGRTLDIYDVHTDAGSTSLDIAARAKNLRQLADAITTRSAGRAVIVAGDFNARYAREGDTVPALLAQSGLRDVWVEQHHAGVLPTPSMPAVCSTTEPDDPACERIDKVLFRGSSGDDAFGLQARDYAVEGAKFSDANGAQLSDHRPVSVTFEITAP